MMLASDMDFLDVVSCLVWCVSYSVIATLLHIRGVGFCTMLDWLEYIGLAYALF